MRKISVGLVLVLWLVPAAPAAGATLNGPIAYELNPKKGSSCRDIAVQSRRGDLKIVAATGSCEADGRFSPSGRRVAWTAFDEDGPTRLHVAGRRGREPRAIADEVHFGWGWSDTDDRLVYGRTPDGPLANKPDLWVTDAFGHEHHALTDTPERAEMEPSWSPDGSRIAFIADDGDLYTIEPDGTDEIRLTEGAEVVTTGWDTESYPAWSPDSSKIAFVSVRDDTSVDDGGLALTAEIYVVPSAGGKISNVSNLPKTEDLEPLWLDDGRLVWVAGYGPHCDRDCDADIYAARWDGTRRRVVVAAPATEWSPVVSPDGRWIAFNRTARRDRHSGVYKVRSDGTGLTKLMGVRQARPDVDDWGRA